MVVYVGNPIIGTCILYVEQVENVEPEPNVLEIAEESAVHNRIRSPDKLVRETEVYTFVGRSAEIAVLIACARGCDGKAAGQDAFQVQLDAFVTGKIILEKKAKHYNLGCLASGHIRSPGCSAPLSSGRS